MGGRNSTPEEQFHIYQGPQASLQGGANFGANFGKDSQLNDGSVYWHTDYSSPTQPLALAMPVHYGARHGKEDGMRVRRRQQNKHHLIWDRWRITPALLIKALMCIIVPPILFLYTSSLLSFSAHFQMPKRVWMLAFLGLIPVLLAIWGTRFTYNAGLDYRWTGAAAFLFSVAFGAGMLLGDMNYLTNLHHFYFIQSLKSYSNINPSEVGGAQLMDAGRVQFSQDAKLQIDMGMSFTLDDVYCVAPISVGGGSSAEGPSLASYDVWAVGKNCCRTSNPTFACGEYRNPKARSGLRQTDEQERLYFNLAVQQAEAAYGITSQHPVFFYWVEDADAQMQSYFNNGFRTWVFMIFAHMTANLFVVVVLINVLKYQSRALFRDPYLPGQFSLGHSTGHAVGEDDEEEGEDDD